MISLEKIKSFFVINDLAEEVHVMDEDLRVTVVGGVVVGRKVRKGGERIRDIMLNVFVQ